MDDIGWNDVGFNGGQFPTPNIDALHAESVYLNRHYIHLMCSPSRSQMITGRYAMYQGYGKMLPWDYTEIGGIPVGQPTIAQWLKEVGGYTTYAVGKWHMGYASAHLLPTARGFDHFFGFYQGAIHYHDLKYIDIKYGYACTPFFALNLSLLFTQIVYSDSNHFDFWEDDVEMKDLATSIAQRHEAINAWTANQDVRSLTPDETATDYAGQSIFDDNTMYLYRDQILQYIDAEIYNKDKTKIKKQKNRTPFYMYLALQTIHGPLNEVPSKIEECANLLASDAVNRRQKYCQNMLLTDDVVGDIVNKLKEQQSIWDNTLIVFTSDNGGDVSNKGCNYPLRGTKGTLYDGNLRTIAMVAGGIVPEAQRGTSRDVLFSSLDWTPTLLKFADVLHKIKKNQMTWDGQNQYDLIMNNDVSSKRDHITLNIGLRSLESASIIFEYEDGKLYKYISKTDSGIDRWAYIRDDGWCIPDGDGNFNLILDGEVSDAKEVDNKYVFCLSDDIAEKTNLLQYESTKNAELVKYAKTLMTGYTEHYLFSEPLTFLWNRLPAGDPTLLGDGSFVSPFLNDKDYSFHLRKGFSLMDAKYESIAAEHGVDVADISYSKALQALYFKKWEAPTSGEEESEDETEDEWTMVIPVNMWTVSLLVFSVCMSVYVLCKFWFAYNYKRDGYKLIDSSDDDEGEITVLMH